VYADLNNDGQLDATTELLYQGLGVISPTVVVRLSSLTLGLVYNTALRLRIYTDYAGSPASGPCANVEKGQVADYALQVLPNTLVPQAAFQLTYTQPCGPVTVQLTNTSRGNANVQWSFGDGTSSTLVTPPAHTYLVPGAYTIRLTVTNAIGTDSSRQDIAVAAACPSYCQAPGYGGANGVPTYFTRVHIADFDNQQVRDPATGNYDFTSRAIPVRQGQLVSLRAEAPAWPYNEPPSESVMAWADFNHDGQFTAAEILCNIHGASPYEATFRLPPSAALGATRLRLLIFLTIDYANNTFALNACSPGFAGVDEEYTLLVLPAQAAPQSGFTADQLTSCSGLVQFRDTTGYSPTTWQWEFGDGTSSTSANPLHTYSSPGTYSVTLQTRNAYGTSTVSQAQYITITELGQGPHPLVVPLSTRPPCCTYGIDQAQLATLTYVGGEDQLGYQDETCSQPALHLTAGNSYAVAVTRTPRVVYNQIYLWLDANDDGVFDATEKIFGSGCSTGEVKAGTFLVPPAALRDRPLRLRLFWHGLRYDDGKNSLLVPDPQTREEEYDQVRDFTVWVSGTALAVTSPAAVSAWSVYPNPTTGVVSISGADARQGVQLFNSLGQLSGSFTAAAEPNNSYQVDVRLLPKGLYLLQVVGVAGAKRLVIQ